MGIVKKRFKTLEARLNRALPRFSNSDTPQYNPSFHSGEA